MGAEVHEGRWTTESDDEIVVFLIGMRMNKLLAVRRWLPAFRAMGSMLRQLSVESERGLLGYRVLNSWRGVTVVEYWRSHADLQRYAHDEMHRAAWVRYYRSQHKGHAAGIWHETYVVPAGSYETFYGNMPALGLGRALGVLPIGKASERAEDRLNRSAS